MRLLSPAKINLFLHIVGKRTDGYHTLATLMCCVGLYDVIDLEFETEGISIGCSHPQVPQNRANLAYRAAEHFFAETGHGTGVRIRIEKHIPVGAGLGGGSSNAAAVLCGLNRHCGNPLSLDKLAQLGIRIGADVPFFIYGKPAIATGIGEILEPYPGLEPYSVLLVFPGIGLSTAEMFSSINLQLTKEAEETNIPFFRNKHFDPRRDLYNDFERVAEQKFPELADIRNAILASGATGALLSGSGSAVYGLFHDRGSAERASSVLVQRAGWQVFVADLIL